MKVNFFDLKRLYRLTEHDIDREIRHVLESGYYILGPKVEEFEKLFSAQHDQILSVSCNSGTDALILPLLALGVGPGDEVITVSHTAIPTIAAIRATGATPVFAEIDPATWLMDIGDAVSQVTSKTRAIIAVHLYGNMVDVTELQTKINEKNLNHVTVIEDCAQSQGSKLHGQVAGTIADFGSFSFYPTKNIGGLGDGGLVLAKKPAQADSIKRLRFYGQRDRYNAVTDRGINSRLAEMQAAVLVARMKYLPKWQEKKEQIREKYKSEFDGLPITFQSQTENCNPNWHLCVVALSSLKARDSAIEQLDKLGVQALVHYPIPTHKQEAFRAFSVRPLPVTESVADRILSIPMNPVLLPEEVDHVVATLKNLKWTK